MITCTKTQPLSLKGSYSPNLTFIGELVWKIFKDEYDVFWTNLPKSWNLAMRLPLRVRGLCAHGKKPRPIFPHKASCYFTNKKIEYITQLLATPTVLLVTKNLLMQLILSVNHQVKKFFLDFGSSFSWPNELMWDKQILCSKWDMAMLNKLCERHVYTAN